MEEGKLELKDGRWLAYTSHGTPGNKPVLYFHGTPSSSKEIQLLKAFDIDPEELLVDANMNLIAIDRPGMGRSSFNPNGDFKSFAQDVNELMEEMEIESAPLICWSGGGTYSLAMANYFPRRIEAVYIICGFSRRFEKEIVGAMGFNKYYFIMAKKYPRVLQFSMNLLKRKKIKGFIPQRFTGLSYVDYALLSDPATLSDLADVTMKQACLFGAEGAVYEAANYFNDPGYELSSISVPVHYWWGTMDMSVIIHHAEAIEKNIKDARIYYREGEGHLSLYVNSFAEVLQMANRQ